MTDTPITVSAFADRFNIPVSVVHLLAEDFGLKPLPWTTISRASHRNAGGDLVLDQRYMLHDLVRLAHEQYPDVVTTDDLRLNGVDHGND